MFLYRRSDGGTDHVARCFLGLIFWETHLNHVFDILYGGAVCCCQHICASSKVSDEDLHPLTF